MSNPKSVDRRVWVAIAIGTWVFAFAQLLERLLWPHSEVSRYINFGVFILGLGIPSFNRGSSGPSIRGAKIFWAAVGLITARGVSMLVNGLKANSGVAIGFGIFCTLVLIVSTAFILTDPKPASPKSPTA